MTLELALKLLTAVVALIATIGTVIKLFDLKSQNEKMAAVGRQFTAVVESLASDNEVKRRSGAILLRRFFDPDTESGVAGTPYSGEAVGVIAALLRKEPDGVFQKLMADGLAYAPAKRGKEPDGVFQKLLADRLAYPPAKGGPDSGVPDLTDQDFQGANLSNAFLGDRDRTRKPVDISHADFFEANLSAASLTGARATKTVFYHATMVGTRMERADLKQANFCEAILEGARFAGADLEGAQFTGATLNGARFGGALNVPEAIRAHLDEDDIYRDGR